MVNDDVVRRVRVHYIRYGTECNEWKDDSEIGTLSPLIEGRSSLEYAYHNTVWQFLYSLASKQIS